MILRSEQKSPIELFDLAKSGGEAETVKRVLGVVLQRELDRCLSLISEIKPDLGEYARLAGEVRQIYRLKKSLDLKFDEGKDAADKLMS